jgi:hypothetical protein
MPAPTQSRPKTRCSQRFRARRTAYLEHTDGDEEAAGQVDHGVHGGVPVADHEEPEEDGHDPADHVPPPHLLEAFGDGVADCDVVGRHHVGHGHDVLLGE